MRSGIFRALDEQAAPKGGDARRGAEGAVDGQSNGTTASVAQAQAGAAGVMADDAMRGRLEELESVYAFAPVGLCVIDRDFRWVRINERLAEINGFPAAAHVGKRIDELLPELWPTAEPLLRRVIETGEPIRDVEIVGETPARPGVRRVWKENFFPLRSATGEVVGINVVCVEVTAQVEADEALRQQREINRALVENAPVGVVLIDLETLRFTAFNERAARQLGYTRDEFAALRLGDVDEGGARAAGARLAGGGAVEFAARHRAKDGEWREVLVRGAPVCVEERMCFCGVFEDVTERRAQERALRDAEQRFRLAVEAVEGLIYEWDLKSGTVTRSPALVRMLGHRPEDVPATAEWWGNQMHQEDRARETERFAALVRDPRFHTHQCEYRVRHRDGHWVHVWDRTIIERDAEGEPVRVVGCTVDITERKAAEQRLLDSGRLLREILDSAPGIVYVRDADDRFLFANRALADLAGVSTDQLVGKRTADFFTGTDVEKHLANDRAAARAGHPLTFEETTHTAHTELHFLSTKMPILWQGESPAVLGFCMEITARKRAERELRESQEQLRTALAAAQAVGWMYDAVEDRYTFAANYAEIFGPGTPPVTAAEFVARILDEDRLRHEQTLVDAAARGGTYRSLYRVRRGDGLAVHWIEEHGRAERDEAGRQVRRAGVVLDVTERRRAEEATARLAAIVETSDDAIVGKSVEGVITSWNQAAERMFGYTAAEAVGRTLALIIPPDRHEEEIRILNELRAGRRVREFETVRRRKDGVMIDVALTVSPIRDARGVIVGASKIARDITARKRSERAVAESQRLVRSLLDNAPAIIYLKDNAGRLLMANQRLADLLGRPLEEIIGRSEREVFPPAFQEQAAAHDQVAWTAGGTHAFEESFDLADGRHHYLSVRLRAEDVGFAGPVLCCFCTDITDRKRMEDALRDSNERLEAAVLQRTRQLEESYQRLRLSERMASIGTLSAGIGHDMGNLLMPIRVRVDSLDRADLGPEQREDVAAIRTCAEYLQRLASGLRLLALDPDARGDGDEPLELQRWWTDLAPMMRAAVPRGVALEAEIPGGLPALRVPRHQLTQVVFNLVQNAGHASKGRPGARVVVRAWAHEGGLMLEVRDNGVGMTPEVKARCMEPFFTTKARGVSTGLGLALVAGFVERAGGKIGIESEPDHGTSFTLTIPAAAAAAERMQRGTARVTLAQPRLVGLVGSILRGLDVEPLNGERDGAAGARLLVTDAAADALEFAARTGHHVVMLGEAGALSGKDRVTVLPGAPGVAALREALRAAVGEVYAVAAEREGAGAAG